MTLSFSSNYTFFEQLLVWEKMFKFSKIGTIFWLEISQVTQKMVRLRLECLKTVFQKTSKPAIFTVKMEHKVLRNY